MPGQQRTAGHFVNLTRSRPQSVEPLTGLSGSTTCSKEYKHPYVHLVHPGHTTCVCVQARQALTAALKIWWDNAPDWQPALLPAIFVGAKAAALDRMADTIKVLWSLTLLLLLLLLPQMLNGMLLC